MLSLSLLSQRKGDQKLGVALSVLVRDHDLGHAAPGPWLMSPSDPKLGENMALAGGVLGLVPSTQKSCEKM